MFILTSSRKKSNIRCTNTFINKHRKTHIEITYHDYNGLIETESWVNKNGELHSIDAPAYIEYFENGNIERKAW